MAELRSVLKKQQLRIEELEAQVRRDSSNSGKPPSSDPPWKDPDRRRKPGKRKRGGQRGHKRHQRELVTADEVIIVRPTTCRRCSNGLSGNDATPHRHQVTEVPPIKPHVTEYQLHALCCQRCNKSTRAKLPEGVPRGMFGPRLQAMVSVCSGAYRLSKRTILQLMKDFFGVVLSTGSVSNLERATSSALADPFAEASARVRASPVVHADETGWYEAAQRRWLWVATTPKVTAFLVRPRRNTEAAQELLGKHFAGVLVTDQFRGYDWVNSQRRQFCWAHLLRHFRALLDFKEAKVFGQRCLDIVHRLFEQWHRFRKGKLRRRDLPSVFAPIQKELGRLFRQGKHAAHPRVRSLCNGASRLESCLWTFVRRKGVEPTNNPAERALRHAVIWRKTSFGTDSEAGSRFVERVLTVVGTLRLQQRNILQFLVDASRNALVARPAPSLFQPDNP